jgi:hypothetical protein
MIEDPRVLQVAVMNGVFQARLRLRATRDGGLGAPISNADPFDRKVRNWRVNEAEPPAFDFDPKDEARTIAHLQSLLELRPGLALVWVEDAEQLDPGGEATVLLVPLDLDRWRDVNVGREIDMLASNDDGPVGGPIMEGDSPRAVGRATIVDVNLRPDRGLIDDDRRPIEE